MNLYHDVLDFTVYYELPIANFPQLLNRELNEFRVKFLKEELQEYIDAYESGDLVGATDALIDLVYVALGTAAMMGIPFNSCWAPVQNANMNMKYRSPTKSSSERGGIYDVLKLPTYVAPNAEIAKILKLCGADL